MEQSVDDRSVIQCLAHILENETSTDVSFKFNESSADDKATIVSAHKLILCARSSVFEGMFNGNFVEKHEVHITDSTAEAFREMIRYLYTDEVQLTENIVSEIRGLAQKYILRNLERKCLAYMKRTISPSNVCDLLNQSVQVKDHCLIQICLDVCANKTAEVLKSEGFKSLSQPALLTFLRHEYLDINAEENIIKASADWAERRVKPGSGENDIRKILGNCVYEMRFLQLSAECLASMFDRYSFLTDREMLLLLRSRLTKNVTYARNLYECGFSDHSRTVICRRIHSGQRTTDIQEEVIDLSVSEDCYIVGVSVYEGTEGKQHDVDIELRDESDDTVLATVQSTFFSLEDKLMPLSFNKNVKLAKGKRYIIKAKVPQGINCCFAGTCKTEHVIIYPYITLDYVTHHGKGQHAHSMNRRYSYNQMTPGYVEAFNISKIFV